jgi:hypothetical protein
MANRMLLSLLVGPVVPGPAPPPVVQALKSVQVTTGAGQRSGFQLSFGLSSKGLLNTTLLPAGYFDPGIRVIVMVVLNGTPNVLMDGIVTRQEVAPSNDVGGSVLTVTGEDVSVMMDLIELPGIPFPPLPAAGRIAMIIAKYALFGMIPVVVPELFPDVPIPTQQIDFQKGTDLAYIEQLAKENGYTFYIDPGPAPGVNMAYWGPEIRIGVPQSALNINMDAHTNVESLNFSFDGLSRKQVAIMVQEPITKISIPIPVPDISLLRPPLAIKQAPALRFEPLKDVAKLNPFAAVARGLAKAAESSDAVTGNGQLDVLRYGHILKARGLVGVRGAGTSYDGLYYVKSVTHNIKPGEYKQSFTLTRNGLISITPAVVP